jgi:hypothetical protein
VLNALSVLPVLGAVTGIVLSLIVEPVCVDRVDESFCRRTFLVWKFPSPVAIGLSAALGAVAGMALYAVAAVFLMTRRPRA